MEIEQILNQISPLSSQSIQLIADKIQLIRLPKNTTLIDADKVEKKLYFIKKGIVRAYTIDDGKEITFWFGKEGDLILSMRFISRQLGTAIDRYKKLLEENPSLINRVQLGYIASYLGISQVTLSRIRTEI